MLTSGIFSVSRINLKAMARFWVFWINIRGLGLYLGRWRREVKEGGGRREGEKKRGREGRDRGREERREERGEGGRRGKREEKERERGMKNLIWDRFSKPGVVCLHSTAYRQGTVMTTPQAGTGPNTCAARGATRTDTKMLFVWAKLYTKLAGHGLIGTVDLQGLPVFTKPTDQTVSSQHGWLDYVGPCSNNIFEYPNSFLH